MSTSTAAGVSRWAMVARQSEYWITVYKRTWKGSAVSSFVLPLFSPEDQQRIAPIDARMAELLAAMG